MDTNVGIARIEVTAKANRPDHLSMGEFVELLTAAGNQIIDTDETADTVTVAHTIEDVA